MSDSSEVEILLVEDNPDDLDMTLRALRTLEVPAPGFDEPQLEWRRLFAEVFGTFLLVLVGAGGVMVAAAAADELGLAMDAVPVRKISLPRNQLSLLL